jgi:hypothetical protein
MVASCEATAALFIVSSRQTIIVILKDLFASMIISWARVGSSINSAKRGSLAKRCHAEHRCGGTCTDKTVNRSMGIGEDLPSPECILVLSLDTLLLCGGDRGFRRRLNSPTSFVVIKP